MKSPLSWYDRFAKLYDVSSLRDRFYRAARQEAVERLAPARGDVVFDLFCGSGVNFGLLRDALAREGTIVGVDGSAGMLRKAEDAARRLTDGALAIELLQADFTTPAGIATVTEAIARHRPTRFLFTLGLTCLPNWRAFFRTIYESAPPAAAFAILDVHSERLTPGARLINWIGAADCTRPVWHELQASAADFDLRRFRPFNLIDVSVVVAGGSKA